MTQIAITTLEKVLDAGFAQVGDYTIDDVREAAEQDRKRAPATPSNAEGLTRDRADALGLICLRDYGLIVLSHLADRILSDNSSIEGVRLLANDNPTTQDSRDLGNLTAELSTRLLIPFEIVQFVLEMEACGHAWEYPPALSPIAVRHEDHVIPALRRIHVSVDPVVTPEQLATLYRDERDRTKGGTVKPPSLNRRALQLALLRRGKPKPRLCDLLEHVPPPRAKKRNAETAPETTVSQRATYRYANLRRELPAIERRFRNWCSPSRNLSAAALRLEEAYNQAIAEQQATIDAINVRDPQADSAARTPLSEPPHDA